MNVSVHARETEMDRLIRIEGKIKKEARSHGRKPEQTEQKKIEKQSG